MPRPDQHLSDETLDYLNEHLASISDGPIKNVEMLDGYFAALACCPELIMPSEYLPYIQNSGGEHRLDFSDIDDAQDFFQLITDFWNIVNAQFLEDMVFLPLLEEDDKGVAHGNNWADGFMQGVNMRRHLWQNMMESDEDGGSIVPIFALAYEHNEDPELRPYADPISPEQREDLIIGAAAGTMRMYKYFRRDPDIGYLQENPFISTSAKVGRNEPCPCGSGKKFKKCCGGVTFH